MATVYTLRIISNWADPGDGRLLAAVWQQRDQRPVGDPFPYHLDGHGPWDDQKKIIVVGCHLIHQVVTPPDWTGPPADAVCDLVIGSGHGGDGPDVFVTTGGNGSSQTSFMYPAGEGFPQGYTGAPNYAHFDMYGSCYTPLLRQRGIALIHYIEAP